MSFTRDLIESTFQHLPLSILTKLTGNPAIFPYYHLVSDHIPWYYENTYLIKTLRAFEKDIDFLLKHFKPVSLEQILICKKENRPIPKNSFHLTFDDGYSEVYSRIYPVLKKKGISATTFLCSGLIDNKAIHWEQLRQIVYFRFDHLSENLRTKILSEYKISNKSEIKQLAYNEIEKLYTLAEIMEININEVLTNEKPYLDCDQINEMIHHGFTFGAHTIHHVPLQNINLNLQIQQVKESVEYIAAQFNIPYSVFAFPYGEFDLSQKLHNIIFNELNIDLCFGTRGIIVDENKQMIQRIWMENAFGPSKTLKIEYARKFVRQLVKNDLVKRQVEC